jgi:hypothetical protein
MMLSWRNLSRMHFHADGVDFTVDEVLAKALRNISVRATTEEWMERF